MPPAVNPAAKSTAALKGVTVLSVPDSGRASSADRAAKQRAGFKPGWVDR